GLARAPAPRRPAAGARVPPGRTARMRTRARRAACGRGNTEDRAEARVAHSAAAVAVAGPGAPGAGRLTPRRGKSAGRAGRLGRTASGEQRRQRLARLRRAHERLAD